MRETKYHQQSLTDLLTAQREIKSQELKHVLQVHARETTLGDKKYDCCRVMELLAQRCLMSKREIETNTDLQWKFHADVGQEEKEKMMMMMMMTLKGVRPTVFRGLALQA